MWLERRNERKWVFDTVEILTVSTEPKICQKRGLLMNESDTFFLSAPGFAVEL